MRGRCHQRPTTARHSGQNPSGKRYVQACPLRRGTRHEVGSGRHSAAQASLHSAPRTSLKMESERLVRRNEKETTHACTHPIRTLDWTVQRWAGIKMIDLSCLITSFVTLLEGLSAGGWVTGGSFNAHFPIAWHALRVWRALDCLCDLFLC